MKRAGLLIFLCCTACQSLEERVQELEKQHQSATPGSEEQIELAFELVEAYDQLGALDKMRALGETATEDLNGASLLFSLAEAYAKHSTTKQELGEARELAESGLELVARLERPESMAEDRWKLQRDGERGFGLQTRGIIDVKLGRFPEAIDALVSALAVQEDPSARLYLGRALALRGRKAEAAVEYAQVTLGVGEEAALAEQALAALSEEGLDVGQARDEARNKLKQRVARALLDEPLPDFEPLGEGLDPKALADGITIIDFWASWCEPCKVEFPILQAFHEAHGSAEVRLLTVSLDEDKGDAEKFLDRGDYTLPMLWDADGGVGDVFGVHGLPTLIVVADGRVRFRVMGLDPALAVTLPARIELLRAN